MATKTDFVDNETKPALLGSEIVKAENIIDFSSVSASAADVIQLLKVSSGDVVLDLIVEVLTAEGGVATADIGDGDDANGYDDAVDLNVTGLYRTTIGTDAYAVGRRYSADDTIDMTLDNDVDASKIRVMALIAKAEKTASSDARD